jgi:hypothetical protein
VRGREEQEEGGKRGCYRTEVKRRKMRGSKGRRGGARSGWRGGGEKKSAREGVSPPDTTTSNWTGRKEEGEAIPHKVAEDVHPSLKRESGLPRRRVDYHVQRARDLLHQLVAPYASEVVGAEPHGRDFRGDHGDLVCGGERVEITEVASDEDVPISFIRIREVGDEGSG